MRGGSERGKGQIRPVKEVLSRLHGQQGEGGLKEGRDTASHISGGGWTGPWLGPASGEQRLWGFLRSSVCGPLGGGSSRPPVSKALWAVGLLL